MSERKNKYENIMENIKSVMDTISLIENERSRTNVFRNKRSKTKGPADPRPGWPFLIYLEYIIFKNYILFILLIVGTDTPTLFENLVNVIDLGYKYFTFSHSTAAHRLRI